MVSKMACQRYVTVVYDSLRINRKSRTHNGPRSLACITEQAAIFDSYHKYALLFSGKTVPFCIANKRKHTRDESESVSHTTSTTTRTTMMMALFRHHSNTKSGWHPSYNRCSWFLMCIMFSLYQNVTIIQARTILVTGAAGFVGSHLADTLLERGDDVVVVDEVNSYYDVRIKEGNLKMLQTKYGERVSIYRGDICDTDFLDHVFQRHSVDDIAHMAARAGVRPSILDPFIYVHSNIKATIELLDRAVQYNISNFVFASSSSVYGGSDSTFFSELEQVDRPISPYAATKKSCELFAYAYHRKFGLNTAALRFFTVYGPRGRPDMAVWYVFHTLLC
jgi:dTDP-4-dehydrorhamnose reductase